MNQQDQLTQDFIHSRLDASADAVEAAIVAIYDRQTQEERLHAYSIQSNGVGFGKFDAEFLTSLAVQIKRGRKLTPKQLEVGRKKIKRYWRQLITTMTTKVPEPLVEPRTNEPLRAPINAVERASKVSVVPPDARRQREIERSHELYASW